MDYCIEKSTQGRRIEMRAQRNSLVIIVLGLFSAFLSPFAMLAPTFLIFSILSEFKLAILVVLAIGLVMSALWLLLGFALAWQFWGRQIFDLRSDGWASLGLFLWKMRYKKRYKTADLSNFRVAEYQFPYEDRAKIPQKNWMVYFDHLNKKKKYFGQGFDTQGAKEVLDAIAQFSSTRVVHSNGY